MKTNLNLVAAFCLIGAMGCGVARAQLPGTPASPPPSRTLTGKAVDMEGNPVAGAHIAVRGGPTNVVSGSDGTFKITARISPFLRAVPRALARDTKRNLAGFAEIGENSDLEIKMAPALTVVATLKDPEGQPVTNGYAFFAVDTGFGDGEWVLEQRVPTDAEGRLMDTALPRRSRVRVAIDAPQLGREELSANTNETDVARFEFPPVTLRRGNLKLTGKVLDPRGSPAAGIRVSVSPTWGQASDSTTTDEKGNFKFEHILPGQALVSASGGGMRGSGSFRGGESGVEVRLRSPNESSSANVTATITGTVLDTNGMPAVGVSVMTIPGLFIPPGRPRPEVKTDAQGNFSLQWRSPGSVPMGSPSLIARDPARNLATVQRIAPSTVNQDLQLRPGMMIRGTVVDESSKPLPTASLRLSWRVFMWNDSFENGTVPLNERGEFEMAGLLPDAHYTFTAQIPGRALAEKSITEEQARTNFIQLEPLMLKALDRPLAGLVLDEEEKPVAGAEIRIANQHRSNSGVFTDSKGHFQTVASVDKTKVTALKMTKNASVDAAGGDTNVVIQFPGAPKPPGPTPGVTLEIRCPTNVFKLGDPMPVEFVISNHRTNDFYYVETTEDKERPNDYQLIAVKASGEKIPDPRKGTPISEEASRRFGKSDVLHPGESFTRTVLLNRWASIQEPGKYDIQGICSSSIRPTVDAKSDRVTITVLPRSMEEMADYIRGLTNRVAERLAMNAGKATNPYDSVLHELVMKLMFTGSPEIVPSLLNVMEESSHEGSGFYQALAYHVPPSEEIKQALIQEASKPITDVHKRNWVLLTLRNYPLRQDASARGTFKPVGNTSGISLEIRCTNQVIKAGDEIPVEFIISNLGTEDYKFEDRTYDRSGRMDEYKLTAKGTDGSLLPDPRETFRMGVGGGGFTYGILHPGESFSKVIPLNRWALVKTPDTYEVTASYGMSRSSGSSSAAVTSAPLQISVLPRSPEEMKAYINALAKEIDATIERRGTNTQWASNTELDDLIKRLTYTCSPDAVPELLKTMYEPSQGFWQAEALLYYIPYSQEIKKAISEVASRRGLASNMQYLMNKYGDEAREDEMKQYIGRSLAVDSPQTWMAGALAAQQYADDTFTPRLIALATEPKGAARMQAIYALTLNRTDEGVKTLKTLLNDPETQIRDTVERAIRSAYTSRGNSRGRPLAPDDFDQRYQSRQP